MRVAEARQGWRGGALLLAVVVAAGQMPPTKITYIQPSEEDVHLSITSPAPTEILATWIFEHNDTSYFEVTWSPPAEDDTSSNTTTAAAYTITDLSPCTLYAVSVRAADAANQTLGLSGKETATTATLAPGRPTSVAASPMESRSDILAVTWTQAAVAGHCSVTTNTVTWWLAVSGELAGTDTFTATEQVNLTGLQHATTYSVGVNAAVHGVSGPPAILVNATTGSTGSDPTPRTPAWVVGVSTSVAAVVVAGIAVYFFRDKLRTFRSRERPPPSSSGHGLGLATLLLPADGEVKVGDLREYIKRLEEDTQRGLEEEYEQVQQNSPRHPTLAATLTLNRTKNRFRNILPFDHSRVILPLLPGEPASDYINASHISDVGERQRFVACQGPMDTTIRDLWRLVWQLGAGVVVMLTNLRERGRERCALYWPTKDEPVLAVGDLTVKKGSEAGEGGMWVRNFEIQRGQEQRAVRQYHLTNWPDFGVPSHEHHLLDFIREVRGFVSSASDTIVVHCSAGVGRTGTFIGLWNLMGAVDAATAASVNVKQTVLALRQSRFLMVQTPEQYLYLYKCIAAYLEEPHRWRTSQTGATGTQTAPQQQTSDDTNSYAYDNPAFSGEVSSGEGQHTLHDGDSEGGGGGGGGL